jgi:hypothetical protein
MKPLLSHCTLAVALLLGSLLGCATLPRLDVTYEAPPPSTLLQGRGIHVKFIDNRFDKDIIGKGAKTLYKDFPGNATLIVSKGSSERYNAGIYEAFALFKSVLALHLKNMGLKLLPEPQAGAPQLVIKLDELILDLDGRRWIARVAYEVEFHKDGSVIVKEFKGVGEKYRVEGLTQAHQVMSQTFTETINQLDVKTLYDITVP